jgi:hypothetical protein
MHGSPGRSRVPHTERKIGLTSGRGGHTRRGPPPLPYSGGKKRRDPCRQRPWEEEVACHAGGRVGRRYGGGVVREKMGKVEEEGQIDMWVPTSMHCGEVLD